MRRTHKTQKRDILITGGAGFIGTNLAADLLARTDSRIVLFDNLSRPGVELNLAWLRTLNHPGRLKFVRGDVRDVSRLREAAQNASDIFHLAATSSPPGRTPDPKTEFEVNVTGTVNVLETVRRSGGDTRIIYASTSKIYGQLKSIPLVRNGNHYSAADKSFRGIDESRRVDYHSPVDGTKAVADQFVREYARLYHLPAIALRLGCIAGPGQFGNEGQGWVAHFVYSVLAGRPVTVFGDGLQVRDILHVSDLVSAMTAARAYIGVTAGRAFNIGGGPERAVSVSQMLRIIELACHVPVRVQHAACRPYDQPLYISDNSSFSSVTGWTPHRSVAETVRDIAAFWHANHERTFVPRARHQTRSMIQAA